MQENKKKAKYYLWPAATSAFIIAGIVFYYFFCTFSNSSEDKIVYIDTDDTPDSVYTKLKDVPEIMLQEYIDKKNEVPYEGISIKGGKEVKMLIKSINYRFTKDSYGIYRHLEPFNDNDLEMKIQRFIQAINYSGVFEIEFIIDKQGIPFFLETNFRITQYNSAYTMFGVNFPYLYAKSILNNKLAIEDIHFSEKRPFNAMSEFEDFRISCINGNLSMVQWLKDVHKTRSFQYYDRLDKAPFYYTLWAKLLDCFR